MKKPIPFPREPSADPVYLAAAAVHSLIQLLPAGTAFCIGVVLIVMMTGRLVHHKGSLARATLPFVVQLHWGWHRVERAMERGRVVLDTLFDHAFTWCVTNLPVAPVGLGEAQRELVAIDTSTIARLRAGARLALAGKGFCHRAGRAVRANIVAAATSTVLIPGGRVGRGRRTRFGARCADAVEALMHAFPPSVSQRLIVVDAGMATQDRFAAATDQDARLGRLRINGTWRCAPPPPSGNRGHPTWHDPVLHPGALTPEVEPAEALPMPSDQGDRRVRRWHTLHCEEVRHALLAVLRIDAPAYERPLVLGTTARELTTEACLRAYLHRWPVETNFFVAQDTTAMEMPRAWTEKALERRSSLALLTGSLLQAVAAATGPLAMGPWDRQPMPSAGRLANYLDIHATHCSALALQGVAPRNYRAIQDHAHINNLQQPEAA
jgi:hypothetical protein